MSVFCFPTAYLFNIWGSAASVSPSAFVAVKIVTSVSEVFSVVIGLLQDIDNHSDTSCAPQHGRVGFITTHRDMLCPGQCRAGVISKECKCQSAL